VWAPGSWSCQCRVDAELGQLRIPRPATLPLLPGDGPQPPSGPLFQGMQHRRGFAESKVTAPSNKVDGQLLDNLREALPRVRRVISRTFALNRTTVCGASRRLRVVPPVKLKPKNFRTCGAATALFALLTFSLRRLVAARRFWGWWAVAASKDQLSNWTGSPGGNNDSLQPSIRYKLQTVFVRF